MLLKTGTTASPVALYSKEGPRRVPWRRTKCVVVMIDKRLPFSTEDKMTKSRPLPHIQLSCKTGGEARTAEIDWRGLAASIEDWLAARTNRTVAASRLHWFQYQRADHIDY